MMNLTTINADNYPLSPPQSIENDTNFTPLSVASDTLSDSLGANTIYKGWILMCDESTITKPVNTSHTERFVYLDTTRWIPKFAVASKLGKCLYLYNYEPTNKEINSLLRITNSQCVQSSYRLDNSIRQQTLINYWINKSPKYEDILVRNDEQQHILPNSNCSNRDNKDSNVIDENDSSSVFRFAGLFFKKDKLNKHSSLKRAKSGIQLERKRTVDHPLNLHSVIDPDRHGQAKMKLENRQSLPSPMRPSRSHESLSSSPVKSNTAESIATHESRNSSHKKSIFEDDTNQTCKIIKLNFQNSNSSYSCYSLKSGGKSNNNLKQSNCHSTCSFEIHALHNSILSEENCFEIKCVKTNITFVNDPNNFDYSNQSPLISDNYGHENLLNYNYENNDAFDDDNQNEINDDQQADHLRSNIENHSSRFVPPNSAKVERKTLTDKFRRKSRRDHSVSSSSHHNEINHKPNESCTSNYGSYFFMCRTADEREKWIQCLTSICKPNLINEKHQESSLQIWLLEAKGQSLSSKPNKKYSCDVVLNNSIYARTCSKDKKDILFWGENFEFNSISGDYVRVELYQETIETVKKKSKRDTRDYNGSVNSKSSCIRLTKQVLMGYVNIPVSSIDSSQPVEKWYCLESPSSSNSNYDLNSITSNSTTTPNGLASNGNSNNNSNSNSLTSTPSESTPHSTIGSVSSASLSTTQGFSKGSISIRIKAKYQTIDILPILCYDKLISFFTNNYSSLLQSLEPHLSVRFKEDLATTLVRIAHKLKFQVKFLGDLIMSEIMSLEDNSLTFRGNSLATKSIEAYMKLVGENYLKQTLSDCIRSIIDTTNDLEIDPSKVTNPNCLQANREELVQVLHLVCGRVLNSCVNFPIELKFVFSRLREECKRNGKSDEMCDTLISASIFLRFICPAILSPNLFNLTQEYPQEKAARKLTLAAKTLQTIANFTKFGAKEFYMSFDKMNSFVDEHTLLMREFLRSISTLTEQDLMSLDENTHYLYENYFLDDIENENEFDKAKLKCKLWKNNEASSKPSTDSQSNCDIKYTNESIDLGKQMSLLVRILSTIIEKLDDKTRHKFDELIHILNEIESMRTNQTNMIAASNSSTTLNSDSNSNRLLSYDNRLHFAINKTSSINHIETLNSLLSSVTPPQHAHSLASLSTKNEMMTPTSSLKSDSSNEINESSKSSNYSSQIILNINSYNDKPLIAAAKLNTIPSSTTTSTIENEIMALKQKLKETEQHLKKEQTEKYFIEHRLKQQQQENDDQMKNIINRLIKVEEELRKEQSEMHKILKAKQDLIDIQKKRIEFLSTRVITTNGKPIKPLSNTASTPLTPTHTDVQHPSTAYNQHSMTSNKNGKARAFIKNLNDNIEMPSSSDHKNFQQQQQQIAASPSSSSASMTQFCSYLASNSSLMNDANNKSNKPKQESNGLPSKRQLQMTKSSPNSNEKIGPTASASPSFPNLQQRTNQLQSPSLLKTSEL